MVESRSLITHIGGSALAGTAWPARPNAISRLARMPRRGRAGGIETRLSMPVPPKVRIEDEVIPWVRGCNGRKSIELRPPGPPPSTFFENLDVSHRADQFHARRARHRVLPRGRNRRRR